MADFEGIVERVSKKDKGNWAIKIGDDWLSGRNEPIPEKGMMLKGRYETKDWNGKIFMNIKSYEVVSFPTPHLIKEADITVDTKIHRQSALKCASHITAAYISNSKINVNEAELITIQLAEKFVEYIEHGYKGDFDSEHK